MNIFYLNTICSQTCESEYFAKLSLKKTAEA